MLDAMVSKDGGIRNDGFRSFNEFERNIRPMYEKSSQADAMVKRADSYKNIGQMGNITLLVSQKTLQ